MTRARSLTSSVSSFGSLAPPERVRTLDMKIRTLGRGSLVCLHSLRKPWCSFFDRAIPQPQPWSHVCQGGQCYVRKSTAAGATQTAIPILLQSVEPCPGWQPCTVTNPGPRTWNQVSYSYISAVCGHGVSGSTRSGSHLNANAPPTRLVHSQTAAACCCRASVDHTVGFTRSRGLSFLEPAEIEPKRS